MHVDKTIVFNFRLRLSVPIVSIQCLNFGRWPTWRTILLYNTFISVLYMFRANTCSSSGGQLY